MNLKAAALMANSEDPDQTPRYAASDLDLHYLLRSVGQNLKVNTILCIRNVNALTSLRECTLYKFL